jgi:hypothetical protein
MSGELTATGDCIDGAGNERLTEGPTFSSMRTIMMGRYAPHHPFPRLLSVDVQRVQVLADIMQGFEFGSDCRAYVCLDAEVEEPGVQVC